MSFSKNQNPHDYIAALGQLEDCDIDLGAAALCLAAIDQPESSFERFEHHLQALGSETGLRHQALLKSGAEDDAGTRLAALKHTLSDAHRYEGDTEYFHDLQNMNLMRVIDRRKGSPIALSILYIQAARAQGWEISGLNIPGHFVCRLEKGAERMIFDPFERCALLRAPELRALVKRALGAQAELSASYFESATNRDILVRLLNNIKYRQIETEDYRGALDTVERIRLIAPQEYRILLDAGVLYARLDRTTAAIGVLGEYLRRAPQGRDRHEAELLLRQLTQEFT